MPFSVKDSRAAFIKLTREALANDLSMLKDSSGNPTTTPSVIKYRSSGNTPDYPYVTVNYDNILTPQDSIVNTSYNEDEDRMEYTQFLQILVTIKCYGEDSLSILNKLNRMLSVPYYKQNLRSEAGLSIHDKQSVVDTPALHSTEWVEGATFRISFYTTDTFYDENNSDSFFDSVIADGDIDGRDVHVEINT